MNMKDKSRSPHLFATLGYPGSGKTFFALNFAKQGNAVHLNSDKVRHEMFPVPRYSTKENKDVFEAMDKKAAEALSRGLSVIYDANSTKRSYRQRLRQIALSAGAEYLMLWFETPVAVAMSRIAKRKDLCDEAQRVYEVAIDESVLTRLKEAQEPPGPDEPYVVLDGQAPYETQIKEIQKYLAKEVK